MKLTFYNKNNALNLSARVAYWTYFFRSEPAKKHSQNLNTKNKCIKGCMKTIMHLSWEIFHFDFNFGGISGKIQGYTKQC